MNCVIVLHLHQFTFFLTANKLVLKLKQNIIPFVVSVLVSVCISSYFYFSNKNLYNSLKEEGKITQVYSKFLGSAGTPWYYGKPTADYYFVIVVGVAILG